MISTCAYCFIDVYFNCSRGRKAEKIDDIRAIIMQRSDLKQSRAVMCEGSESVAGSEYSEPGGNKILYFVSK